MEKGTRRAPDGRGARAEPRRHAAPQDGRQEQTGPKGPADAPPEETEDAARPPTSTMKRLPDEGEEKSLAGVRWAGPGHGEGDGQKPRSGCM